MRTLGKDTFEFTDFEESICQLFEGMLNDGMSTLYAAHLTEQNFGEQLTEEFYTYLRDGIPREHTCCHCGGHLEWVSDGTLAGYYRHRSSPGGSEGQGTWHTAEPKPAWAIVTKS